MRPPPRRRPPRLLLRASFGGARLSRRLAGPRAVAAAAAACIVALFALYGLFHALFGDAILSGAPKREAALRADYEERLAVLRHRIDRLASRQVLDRDTLEGTVQDLVTRQARLEMRHAVMQSLVADVAKPVAPHVPDQRTPSAETPPAPPPGPRLFPGQGEPPPGARFERGPGPRADRSFDPAEAERVAALAAKVATLEAMQFDFAMRLSERARGDAERFSRALAELRLDRSITPRPENRGAMGGPLLPVPSTFDGMIAKAKAAAAERARLADLVSALPLARPLEGDAEIASGFGIRTDPFTRRPAMHAGLDLKLFPGAPVRAAGAGTVRTAEWSGGYGNMVEIDHGRGITTIYGHLASIAVRPGQTVTPGTTLGFVGSTGRSTGPHLHYETRIDEEAVDPLRFLRAGERLSR